MASRFYGREPGDRCAIELIRDLRLRAGYETLHRSFPIFMLGAPLYRRWERDAARRARELDRLNRAG